MTVPSPLHAHIADAAAAATPSPSAAQADRPGAATGAPPLLTCEWLPWGPDAQDAPAPELLATTGSIELEYAALRRGVVRFDAANRAVIRVGGADRVDLLDRLLTQKLADITPGTTCESFLIDRKGRLVADLVVVHLDDVTLLDVDIHQVADTLTHIEGMCFGEDVQLEDVTNTLHRIDLHGPAAVAVVAVMGFDCGEQAQAVQVGAATAWRHDRTGVHGVALCVPTDTAIATWDAVAAAASGGGHTCRTIGWYALNMARVEALEPLANIDFGAGNLPAETGVLHRRVSFTKGCYPGQEVVARMFNLGHPKQILRHLDLPDTRLPVAGAQVFAGDDADLAAPLGVVTSSSPAPLASQQAVALAMLRWKVADPDGEVIVVIDGEQVRARVKVISDE